MIFWDAAAHEKGSENVRNRSMGSGTVARVCKNTSYIENGANGNKEPVFASSLTTASPIFTRSRKEGTVDIRKACGSRVPSCSVSRSALGRVLGPCIQSAVCALHASTYVLQCDELNSMGRATVIQKCLMETHRLIETSQIVCIAVAIPK